MFYKNYFNSNTYANRGMELESDINEILLGELIDENGIKKVVGVSSEDENIVSLYFDEIIKEMSR